MVRLLRGRLREAGSHNYSHDPSRWLSAASLLDRRSQPKLCREVDLPTPLLLPPGQSLNLAAQARAAKVGAAEAAPITFHTHAGVGTAEILWIEEEPDLLCYPPRLEAWGGATEAEQEISLRTMHGKLILRSCRLEKFPGEAALVAAGKPPHNLLASVVQGPSVRLKLHAGTLPLGPHKARLAVEYLGPHGPAYTYAGLEIAVRRPPQLRWPGEHQRPRILRQTDRQRLPFQLQNQDPASRDSGVDNADLVITSVELTSLPGAELPVQLLTPMPQRVRGGHAVEVVFELDLTRFEGEPARLHDFKLKAVTNAGVLDRPCPVSIEPSAFFAGVVAIDFGTSNTTCAVQLSGGAPELLPLDGEELISPTILSYLDLKRTPPAIETGARIKRIAVEDEAVAVSTADQLKQRLGERRQEIAIRARSTGEWGTRKASDAASDYLRDIRQSAEAHRNEVFSHFVLTHPARCSLRQHSRLRNALMQAFGARNARIAFLQEPIAALLPFMLEQAQLPVIRPYTVASFDLGGGTTDVAIVRVVHTETAGGQIEIRPSILHCEGQRFGGEDLTGFLRNQLTLRCERFLEVREPGARLITDNTSSVAALDVRRNRAALTMAAENYKASLSEEGSAAAPSALDLRITQPDGQTASYTFDFLVIASSVGPDLEQLFLDFTRDGVRAAARMLLSAVERLDIQLDSIQLSGKTSFLPVVPATLAALFPATPIQRALEPKECVVRGACLSQALQRGRILLQLPDQGQRLTSSLGVFSRHTPFFIPLLHADSPIPPEGLTADLPNAWDGEEHVELWEDLTAAPREIEYSAAVQHLSSLGRWVPEMTHAGPGPWTLRLMVKDFQLSVFALGPNETPVIPFHPASTDGD